MTVKLASVLCLLASLGFASAARASAMVQTTARTDIVQSAGIQVTQDLSFQAVVPATISAIYVPASVAAAASVSSVGSVASASSAAGFKLVGSARDAVSMAVPSAFDVTRAGGVETLTVTTLGGVGNAVIGGALRANGALSVNVGGQVALGGTAVAPGSYHGLLVVIAQYN